MDVEGCEVSVMRGAPQTLARTRHLYVEFAPERLIEQGSTVDEFVDLIARYFVSAYVIDETTRYLAAGTFPEFLRTLPRQRGLLLNLLLTRDLNSDPGIYSNGLVRSNA
jgi:hypothetical protein